MFRFNKVRIRQHERGLHLRHGDLVGVLAPGSYWLPWRMIGRDRVEIVDVLETRFEHAELERFLHVGSLRDELTVVDLVDDQRAFVWKDGRIAYLLGPGRHALWNEPAALAVEIFDVTPEPFQHARLEAVLAHPDAEQYLQQVSIGDWNRALVFQEGRIVRTLDGGRYVFWRGVADTFWKIVDMREQVADVAGQEIMTADKVTLRLNLVVSYQITDAVLAASVVGDAAQALYREAQLALRAAIGSQTLDALLSDKESIGADVRSVIAERAAEFGVTVKNVGLRDVILPGDMKLILNQVIEAQKRAEANLIRRREETAAARSQANTARLLAGNPALARMKELEAIQEILAGAKTTFVFGQTNLSDELRGLAGPRQHDSNES